MTKKKQPTMDAKTMKFLRAQADELAHKLKRAQDVISKPVPMAGKMWRILEQGERPTAKVEFFPITREDVPDLSLDNLRAIVSGRPDRTIHPGVYTRLLTKQVAEDPKDTKWQVMMSDAPYELRSSSEFMEKAKGKVLVAGLGLGASLVPVLRKKTVASVVVVEKSQDVIALVLPYLKKVPGGSKLTVVQGDAFSWSPHKLMLKGIHFDTIWLDIWPSIDTANLPAMQILRNRYKPWLKKGGWLGVWEWDFLHKEEAEYQETKRLMYAPVGGELKPGKEPDCIAVPGVGFVKLSDKKKVNW